MMKSVKINFFKKSYLFITGLFPTNIRDSREYLWISRKFLKKVGLEKKKEGVSNFDSGILIQYKDSESIFGPVDIKINQEDYFSFEEIESFAKFQSQGQRGILSLNIGNIFLVKGKNNEPFVAVLSWFSDRWYLNCEQFFIPGKRRLWSIGIKFFKKNNNTKSS